MECIQDMSKDLYDEDLKPMMLYFLKSMIPSPSLILVTKIKDVFSNLFNIRVDKVDR